MSAYQTSLPWFRRPARSLIAAPAARLLAGHRISGPAVIEQFDATTFLLPGQEAIVDDLGFLVIREQGSPTWTA